jgi:hypothetical protein
MCPCRLIRSRCSITFHTCIHAFAHIARGEPKHLSRLGHYSFREERKRGEEERRGREERGEEERREERGERREERGERREERGERREEKRTKKIANKTTREGRRKGGYVGRSAAVQGREEE